MDLDSLSDLSYKRLSVVAYHLSSVSTSVSEIVWMRFSEVFGQSRLFLVIISDSCNMIQPSAIARVPSLTKVLSCVSKFIVLLIRLDP